MRAYPIAVASTVFAVPRSGAGFRALITSLCCARSLTGADLIHQTGDIHYAVLGMWRYPVALTIHDLRFIEEARGLKRLLFWLARLYLPCLRADRVTVISEFIRDRLLAMCRIDPQKIRVIPNCVAASSQPSPRHGPQA